MKTNLLKRTTYFFIILTSFLSLQSCSSKPQFGDLKKDFEEQISAQSNGAIELVNITETNATDEEFLGQKIHTIFYNIKIKFTKECFLFIDRSGRGPLLFNFKTYDQKPDLMPGGIGHVLSKAEKEEIVEFDGTVTYVETEEGWVKQQPPSIY